MTNFYLVYRPFHLDYVRMIIQTHHHSDENIIIDHFGKGDINEPNVYDSEIHVFPRETLKKVFFLKKMKAVIENSIAENDHVTFFIPHSLGILSNYVLFTLKRKYPHVKISLYYEGVIFFKKYKHSFFENMFFYLSRWMVGFINGIPYLIKEEILDLNAPEIDKLYSPFKFNVPIDKLVITELEKLVYDPCPDSCLILGHAIQYNTEIVNGIVSAMFKKINDLNIGTIFYKDHPVDDCTVFHKTASEYGKTMVIIEKRVSAESIILQCKPKYIISGWSSGLLNLSSSIPPEVKIFSFVNNLIIRKEALEDMIKIFTEQKIEVSYV
ncbi:MAG: polysialyltransferase family glycosyltransferase [Bacteroidales bacterium]